MTKKTAAAFTITRNEPFWLRVWCNYYCDSFDQKDVYIIDNSTTDGSVEHVKQMYPNINIVDAPSNKMFDSLWLKRTVERQQRLLLNTYSAVLFAETDEFLIPDEHHKNIHEYCVGFVNDASKVSVRAKGVAVIHQHDKESPTAPSPGALLLSDRNSMWACPDYNKTLITKVPLTYGKGFHYAYKTTDTTKKDVDKPIEPDLFMLHGWQIDLDMYHQRHVQRVASGATGMHGSSDLGAVKEFFATRVAPWDPVRFGEPLYVGDELPVPEYWKRLLRY